MNGIKKHKTYEIIVSGASSFIKSNSANPFIVLSCF